MLSRPHWDERPGTGSAGPVMARCRGSPNPQHVIEGLSAVQEVCGVSSRAKSELLLLSRVVLMIIIFAFQLNIIVAVQRCSWIVVKLDLVFHYI